MDSKKAADDEAGVTALGVPGLGLDLDTVTVVGGNTLGTHGLLEGVLRLSELPGHKRARRWTVPLLATAALAGMYAVVGLAYSVPQTVGRRVARELAGALLRTDTPKLCTAHAERSCAVRRSRRPHARCTTRRTACARRHSVRASCSRGGF
jgi:hypothetical protein